MTPPEERTVRGPDTDDVYLSLLAQHPPMRMVGERLAPGQPIEVTDGPVRVIVTRTTLEIVEPRT